MMPLAMLSPGEHAEVVQLKGVVCDTDCSATPGDAACDAAMTRASDLGLRCGQVVEMLSNSGGGPLLLKVENTRIALGRGLARQVLVNIVEGDRL